MRGASISHADQGRTRMGAAQDCIFIDLVVHLKY